MPDTNTDTGSEDVKPIPEPQREDVVPSGQVETTSSAQAVPSAPIEDADNPHDGDEDVGDDGEVSISAHAAVRALKRNMIRPVDEEV